jgi:hypothetical protein
MRRATTILRSTLSSDLRNDVATAQDDRLELFLLTLFIQLLALRARTWPLLGPLAEVLFM